jgi:hypothetical protein
LVKCAHRRHEAEHYTLSPEFAADGLHLRNTLYDLHRMTAPSLHTFAVDSCSVVESD